MGTLEFGLSSGDDDVMGSSLDALAVLAMHHIACVKDGKQGALPSTPVGAHRVPLHNPELMPEKQRSARRCIVFSAHAKQRSMRQKMRCCQPGYPH